MSEELTADWLQQLLRRHDPLAAWSDGGFSSTSDYRREAELTAEDLREVLGLGHARTVVADALDRVHPGVYQALAVARVGDELSARVGRIAREIWEHHGLQVGSGRASHDGQTDPLPESPPIDDLVRHGPALVDWLRTIELHLAAEVDLPGTPPGPAASALLSVLPPLVDAYLEASAERRASLRLTFSRFRLVCYGLSSFAAVQSRLLDGPHGAEGLRRCLAAESLLDLHLDWRDELLVLRDVRQVAAARGLA